MSYAYGDTRSTRNHFRETPSIVEVIVERGKKVADACASVFSEDHLRLKRGRPYGEEARKKGWLRRMFTVVLLLQVIWVWTLYYSERTAFSSAIKACDWRRWENWAPDAQPHHVALVADPQLVDPHTYPGRPWPLSTLTIRYTDLYLKRVYRLMQEQLYPDSTVFLGDLFDGGREWKVSDQDNWESTDKSWKSYDGRFWLSEYNRFGKIFFDIFTTSGIVARRGQGVRRKIISTLPGNHDLGFSTGVHLPVRKRFETYYGEGNRVDILGNHTFVSIDGVSLSARDHADQHTEEIWKPTLDFLNTIGETRKKAVAKELQYQYGVKFTKGYEHAVVKTEQLEKAALPQVQGLNETRFPAVLITHVPLYRDPGTPCGPYREHWPPARGADGKFLEKDDRNAIAVQAGYQYQNVLSHDVTKDVTTKIGDIQYAFSGDDHDHCDVTHMRYPSGGGGIREITVKSISWAMGVRKPGFETLSLWNPVDNEGRPIGGASNEPTLQSHLCLMPDQLSIFIRYGMLFVVTLSVLLIRAGHMASNPAKSAFAGSESPILPTLEKAIDSPETEGGKTSSSIEGSLGVTYERTRRSRAPSATSGSASPASLYALSPNRAAPQGYSLPLVQHAGFYCASVDSEKGMLRKSLIVDTKPSKAKRLKGLALFYAELRWTLLRVAFVAGPVYAWLIWSG